MSTGCSGTGKKRKKSAKHKKPNNTQNRQSRQNQHIRTPRRTKSRPKWLYKGIIALRELVKGFSVSPSLVHIAVNVPASIHVGDSNTIALIVSVVALVISIMAICKK